MFFLMRCLHHSGMDAKRDTHRAEHRDWVKSGGDGLAAVLIGLGVVLWGATVFYMKSKGQDPLASDMDKLSE